MYTTIANVRDRIDLGMTDETDYPDEVLTILLNKAQIIVDAYMRQSIEADTEDQTEYVKGTPNMLGGISFQAKRRFINSVTSITIQYGFGLDDYEVADSAYQYDENLGTFDTNVGGRCFHIFDSDTIQNYKVELIYQAGLDPIPDDFLEAYYAVLYKMKEDYGAKGEDGEPVTVSNQISKYTTLNEKIEFVTETLSNLEAKNVVNGWVETVLNKYSTRKKGVGTYM